MRGTVNEGSVNEGCDTMIRKLLSVFISVFLLAGSLALMFALRRRKPAEPACDREREALEIAWAALDEAERDEFGDCLSPVDRQKEESKHE